MGADEWHHWVLTGTKLGSDKEFRNGMSTNVETNNTRITAVRAIPRRRERNSLSGLCATEFLSRESQKYRANKQPIKGSATIYSSRYLIRKMAMKNADKIA